MPTVQFRIKIWWPRGRGGGSKFNIEIYIGGIFKNLFLKLRHSYKATNCDEITLQAPRESVDSILLKPWPPGQKNIIWEEASSVSVDKSCSNHDGLEYLDRILMGEGEGVQILKIGKGLYMIRA